MKKLSSGKLATLLVILVAIVLLTVFTFAIPFDKHSWAILITAYVCAILAILYVGFASFNFAFGQGKLRQAVMAYPLIRHAIITCALQMLVTILFYVLNALLDVPFWILAIVETLIVAYGVVTFALGYFYKGRSDEFHERNQAQSRFMDEFQARLTALDAICRIESVKSELRFLLDTARGSDPYSNEKTLECEADLRVDIRDLSAAIKGGDEAEARRLIAKTKDDLLERNAMCKLGY